MATSVNTRVIDREIVDPIAVNRIKEQITTIDKYMKNFQTRWSRFGGNEDSMDPRRDIGDECGYPDTSRITLGDYRQFYTRHPIAKKVVEILPKHCWQNLPTVTEEDDPEIETPFEIAIKELGRNLQGSSFYKSFETEPVWDYLSRLDRVQGIGHYGVPLIGIAGEEGKDLSQPLKFKPSKKATRELIYLKVFPDYLARITQSETNQEDSRFGLPTTYGLSFDDSEDLKEGVATARLGEHAVHWTRVVHITDDIVSNEIFHTPRMLPVFNRLLDLDKLYGGSAEMYWKGAFQGLSFETHPQLGGDVEIDVSALQDMAEKYQNGLQRILALTGMSANSLAPQVVDPSAQIDVQIEAICIEIDCPKRIFVGSERGELASSQDSRHWNDVIVGRRENYLTPRLIVPVVDRFISLGILPTPAKENGFNVAWPAIETLTPLEKADQAMKITQAIIGYVGGDGNILLPVPHFLTLVLGFSQDEAEAITDLLEDEEMGDVLKEKTISGIVDPEADLERGIKLETAKAQIKSQSKGSTK